MGNQNSHQNQQEIVTLSKLQHTKSVGGNIDINNTPNYAELVLEYKNKLEKERKIIRESLKKDAENKINKITEQLKAEKEAWMIEREKLFEKEREKLKIELETSKKEKS